MSDTLNCNRAADGTITWGTPRATEKPFVIRVFHVTYEKLFRGDASNDSEGLIAECIGDENLEVTVQPGLYNVVGGDWRRNYLHIITVGEDGSVIEKAGIVSDALKNNMFS